MPLLKRRASDKLTISKPGEQRYLLGSERSARLEQGRFQFPKSAEQLLGMDDVTATGSMRVHDPKPTGGCDGAAIPPDAQPAALSLSAITSQYLTAGIPSVSYFRATERNGKRASCSVATETKRRVKWTRSPF